MTSWIDASFVYSTSEAWVNAMRSFQNGTFRQGEIEGIPPRNAERVPIFTAPAPHIMKMSNPEKMLCKSSSAQRWKSLKLMEHFINKQCWAIHGRIKIPPSWR